MMREPISDDLKEKYLDLIASGYTRYEAASALGSSASQFRRLCNPASHLYDKDFHRLMESGLESGLAAFVERLRAAIERGFQSDFGNLHAPQSAARDERDERDEGGRLIYTVDVAERVRELMISEIGCGDEVTYSWHDGYERLDHKIKDGGSSHYAGVYHPEDGYCIGERICIYCGRVIW
jgi:hypothetical protein